MINKRTKKFRNISIIFTILHILCLIGPFLYFIPAAFITGEVVSKVVLGLSTVTSLILAAISFFITVQHRAGLHRGILWFLILGVLTCLSNIKPFICIMALTSICDEVIFTPIRAYAKNRAAINKEIDLRVGG